MEQLEVEGEITKDQIRIKEAAQEFYKNLYKETEGWRPDQRILDVSRITEEEQMGIGDKWLKWIETCIKTVKFSVLVNGESVGYFESERGLRQDDTIILCDPVEEQISYIRVILVLFEAVSGLQVNWGKSSLFPVNEVPQIKEMAGILGCSVGKLPTTYLGMPLGNNHKALEIWDSILEKTEKKLFGWKAQYLSLGG
ncbi:hypothetical protein MTR67_004098 [Solanum verrucosum]|uniref:Uncharacterized protein n=1 Tax=Solanum verrucosum TaxID=315347 RepID=A0AAF0PTS9_SOLVR|nr:hypothetical protein MTR67_004098 [Solanum verrucosum]